MAAVEKFKASAVVNQLRHIERTIQNPENKDIDFKRSYLNYVLSPDREMSSYDYYKSRKEDLYCYNRPDVNTMAGWVVTAPKELRQSEHDEFFQVTYNFLENRYSVENVVSAVVHNDESGQPHLHFTFIPVAADPKHGGEKICANEVLNREELRNFHSDLQRCLDKNGVNARVTNGATAGGNRTVRELKRDRERFRGHERVRETRF